MNRDHLAELYALESFTWIAEDLTDPQRIIADTHAAHTADIADLKAEIVSILSEFVRPEDLTFYRLEDGAVRVSLAVLVTPEGFARAA